MPEPLLREIRERAYTRQEKLDVAGALFFMVCAVLGAILIGHAL